MTIDYYDKMNQLNLVPEEEDLTASGLKRHSINQNSAVNSRRQSLKTLYPTLGHTSSPTHQQILQTKPYKLMAQCGVDRDARNLTTKPSRQNLMSGKRRHIAQPPSRLAHEEYGASGAAASTVASNVNSVIKRKKFSYASRQPAADRRIFNQAEYDDADLSQLDKFDMNL